ncbi:MAG: hypothetical protein AB7R55_20780 [Gemmatimonadales bacterium]
MLRLPSRIALTLVVIAVGAGPLQGQLPGESVTKGIASLRGEFLAVTYEEVQATLLDWALAVERGDTAGIRPLLSQETWFSPVAGWRALDPEETLVKLADWLPTVSSYGFTVSDFDASSSLAYVLGSVHYQRRQGDEGKVVRAEVAVILARRGDRWQVRSYLERSIP